MAQTRIALRLVSEHFLTSAFIQNNELSYLLDKKAVYALEIRWVLISNHEPFINPLASVYQACLHGQPLDQLSPRQLVTALARMGQDLAQQMAGR